MVAHSSQEEEHQNHHNQEIQHSLGEGFSVLMDSSPPVGAAQGRKRNHPQSPSDDVEVISLSPKTLTAKNRFSCEVCHTGFPREQNLQLHRRLHNLPYNLKKTTSNELGKKIYVCPEIGCARHHPSMALGDVSGIKKHFSRKHGEKRFACHKCDKKYGVLSDWKAHDKICGKKVHKYGPTFLSSFSDVAAEEVPGQTTNPFPYRSMASSGLTNASNLSTMSPGDSLMSGSHLGLCFPKTSHISGFQGFPSYTKPSNMVSFGFNSGAGLNFPQNVMDQNINNSFSRLMMNADPFSNHILNSTPASQLYPTALPQKPAQTGFNSNNLALMNSIGSSLTGDRAGLNCPQNEKDQNIDNSFSGLMTNAEPSSYQILNTTPATQLYPTPLLQKPGMTGSNSNNEALMKTMGRSFTGRMKLNNSGGMSWGGRRGDDSSFQVMYNSIHLGGPSYSSGGYRGDKEYLCAEMNTSFGGMMSNVRNADEILVGGVNNNVGVEPHMNDQRGNYYKKRTTDFLDMGHGINSLTGGGMVDDQKRN